MPLHTDLTALQRSALDLQRKEHELEELIDERDDLDDQISRLESRLDQMQAHHRTLEGQLDCDVLGEAQTAARYLLDHVPLTGSELFCLQDSLQAREAADILDPDHLAEIIHRHSYYLATA